jgi:hypothetical protein
VNGHPAKTSENALTKKDFSCSFSQYVIKSLDIDFEDIDTF